jgi:glycerol kinase
VFKSLDQIKRKWKKEKIFIPNIDKKLRNKLLNGWKLAVDRTLL